MLEARGLYPVIFGHHQGILELQSFLKFATMRSLTLNFHIPQRYVKSEIPVIPIWSMGKKENTDKLTVNRCYLIFHQLNQK